MANKKADVPDMLIWIVIAIIAAVIVLTLVTGYIGGQSLGGFRPENLL